MKKSPWLSVIVATIDRPRHLRCALTAYTRWPCKEFDVWVMDDSGEGESPLVCDEFRQKLDLHLVKFDRPPKIWRGPETVYAVGLKESSGQMKTITQEGIMVPYDMFGLLKAYLGKEHKIVNIYTYEAGAKRQEGCEKPDGPSKEEWEQIFLTRPVATEELLRYRCFGNPRFEHPMWYAATAQAWDSPLNFFPLENRPYGDTDGELRNARKRAKLDYYVPTDMMLLHIRHLDIISLEVYEHTGNKGAYAGYDVLY